MPRIRKLIWIIGITLTILVNITGAQMPMYKGDQTPVGPGLVSVHTFRGGSGIPIPVMEWDGSNANDTNGKFVDTGQRVEVSLRNSYKDDIVVSYPRMTLRILGVAILLHFAMDLVIRCRKGPVPGKGR